MADDRVGEHLLRDLLADRLRLREEKEVIGAAGFGIRAGHIEAAKWMRAHDGTRALAIDVQVADVELALTAAGYQR